jgi:hypothetical protein
MPSLRAFRATDDLAREIADRLVRWGLMLLGLAIIALGVLISPIPGPGGIPLIVIGLMIVLRNSFYARRQFVKMQRAHPKMIFPLRRLLRREPEVIPVFWQQTLRVERILLPKRVRFLIRLRHSRSRRRKFR